VVALLLTHEALTTAPQAVLRDADTAKISVKTETINPFLTIAPSLICMNLSGMARPRGNTAHFSTLSILHLLKFKESSLDG
jgi:hypothetical protein